MSLRGEFYVGSKSGLNEITGYLRLSVVALWHYDDRVVNINKEG
jgi:hypothetical protein